MDGGGRDIRRSVTISDHPAGNPDNFPDLNKVRDEDDAVAARALNHRSLTLGSGVKRDAFAARAGAGSSSSRALIDEHAVVSRGSDFKDRMRLRTPAGSGDDHIAAAATGALPTSPVFGRSLTTRGLPRSASGRDRAVSPEVEVEEEEAAAEEEQQPVMSLMALLGGMDEDEEEDDEEEDEEEEEVEAAEEEEHVCCVCMVRHKGPAFVPCAHSFCRLCSREMWVSKGNCPLCNGYILEILDIF